MIHNVDVGHGCTEGKTKVNMTRSPEKIEVSPDTTSLNVSDELSGAIRQIVKQGLAIDPRKIAAARQAIADGKYPANPEELSEKTSNHGPLNDRNTG